MSLTSTLLLGLPIHLPNGQPRMICMDHKNPYVRAHNSAIRQSNCEAVFNAISSGCTTFPAIEDATGLSGSTVKRLMNELEDWPGGPRIKRSSSGTSRRNHFEAIWRSNDHNNKTNHR